LPADELPLPPVAVVEVEDAVVDDAVEVVTDDAVVDGDPELDDTEP